jgi:hypothetical protein
LQQQSYTIGRVYDVHWESVLPQELTTSEVWDETFDPASFLPYPAVSHFDRGILETYNYTTRIEPRIKSTFDHRAGSYTALSKVQHLQSVAASHQFTRPAHVLEQAFDYSGEYHLDLYKTRYWLVRA